MSRGVLLQDPVEVAAARQAQAQQMIEDTIHGVTCGIYERAVASLPQLSEQDLRALAHSAKRAAFILAEEAFGARFQRRETPPG